MARHMFAGGNTAQGFYSFFDEIMPLERAKKRIFLKGSSGSGKSTFLKKAACALENGNEVDYLHCSNDADSLDGIRIDKLGLSIVDGTAPHVCEPALPVVIDSVINFAEFIDGDMARPHTAELIRKLEQKKPFLRKAYGYLSAAQKIYFVAKAKCEIDNTALKALIRSEADVLSELRPSGVFGQNRSMFASAITPDGVKSFADSILQGCRLTAIHEQAGDGAELILSALQMKARERGLDTESFYCPIEPEKIEHLLIPKLNLGYTTVNRRHKCSVEAWRALELKTCSDESLDSGLFDELINRSCAAFRSARDIHDEIEAIFINCMDFGKLDTLTESVIHSLKADISLF